MLRDEVELYSELSGNDGWHTPINVVGAYLDGYEKGRASVDAQPEIIHCGNCKHHSDEKPGMVYCPEIIGGWVKNDCFCAIWEGKR